MNTRKKAYLHLLGEGDTRQAQANNRGHLFEYLMRDLFKSLKIEVTHLNRSKNGTEIDIVGKQLLGDAPVLAECKAQITSLNSEDVQKFCFKFYDEREDNQKVTGFLLTLSSLNTGAQELWDEQKRKHGDSLICYEQEELLNLMIEHMGICSPELIRESAEEYYHRACGDTQLLCVGGKEKQVKLFWAQLLMSSDGTEPNYVVFSTEDGTSVTNKKIVTNLLRLKPEFATSSLTCLNLEDSELKPTKWIDEISPTRTVVRIRKSKSWFDYRFPSAPEFFVGRNIQIGELTRLFEEVRLGKTSIRGVFFSGKSGIGKSSLVLKSQQVLKRDRVILLPIDSRLCDDVSFLYDSVNELLFELRQVPELNELFQNVTVRGLDSLIETLVQIHEAIISHDYLVVLFFDQFEKVFDFPDVTKAIRDIFLLVTERQLSILFGFAWKSDLWSQTEGFPHNERDDIVRECVSIKKVEQFNQEETSEILKQLELQWGERLSILISRQLATFSRGLPWLLKKVCSHLLEQKEKGVTQNELIETNLKMQDLFEADLAGLDDEERSLLRAIAPLLPATLRRISESFEIANIDQSLHRFIDKRILVKITEDVGKSYANVKYDAYSDIFREFLITGTVPFDAAYYFFTYPKGALKFFKKVKMRGKLPIDQEIAETGKQIISIYNLSRDLRQLGLVDVNNKVFTISREISSLNEEDFLLYLQGQLKRNRLVSLALGELNRHYEISLSELTEILRQLFPSVQAKTTTWLHYSKTTAKWLHAARLAFYNPSDASLHQVDDEEIFERVITREDLRSAGIRLPLRFKNAIVECLEALFDYGKGSASIDQLALWLHKKPQSVNMILSDNLDLGFVYFDDSSKIYRLTEIGETFIKGTELERTKIFGKQCKTVELYNLFLAKVDETGESGVSSRFAIDRVLVELKIELADTTLDKLGNILANWAEYAGVISRKGRVCRLKKYIPEQMTLI
ncbi:hypothetical protein MNBD_CHLOROFLEXI01-449 [hydrothermal vent metagenome]|uniref:Restriction endonuclease type IV Mrr domain-containing protein n=1 Tax=hydrothermal vent metagenome TaxID=652676 RepID=A0A3B0VYY2_9ZZZZ